MEDTAKWQPPGRLGGCYSVQMNARAPKPPAAADAEKPADEKARDQSEPAPENTPDQSEPAPENTPDESENPDELEAPELPDEMIEYLLDRLGINALREEVEALRKRLPRATAPHVDDEW